MKYLKLNFGAKVISPKSTEYILALVEAIDCGIGL